MDINPLEVREALERLYDGVSLARVPLASRIPRVAALEEPLARAQSLRSILLDAIELLQPARAAAFRSPGARCYEVLYLRYIEALPPEEIEADLHIGKRQFYRDLNRAVEGLAEVLRSYPWPAQTAADPLASPNDPLRAELERMPQQPSSVDVASALGFAIQTVDPLARQLGVEVAFDRPQTTLHAFAGKAFLEHLLVELLSRAVLAVTGNRIAVTLAADGNTADVTLRFQPQAQSESGFAGVRAMAQSQYLGWDEQVGEDGALSLRLKLPAKRRLPVLVVEDNKDAVEMYRRYLASSEQWLVVEAPDPRVVPEMARELRPAVIVLDLLMPQESGWGVLQRLRLQPETAATPILICSVFEEVDLAAALGATAYLKKPVSQFQLLSALHQCLQRRSSPA